MKQTTETSSFTLPEERFYEMATVEKVVKKLIKEVYTIYEFSFSAMVDGEVYNFKVGMFPSGMGDLLLALGAKEIGKNKFDWDDEEVIGKHVSFVLSHQADTGGTLRVVLSDVKAVIGPAANGNPGGITDPAKIGWAE
jgi:hypothetical protein